MVSESSQWKEPVALHKPVSQAEASASCEPTTTKLPHAPDSHSPSTNHFKMSDSDDTKAKPSVPSWQTKSTDETPKEDQQSPSEPQTRESIIKQAKRFLEEDEVRDASTDKKIAFLESKGLQGDEIQQLLGVSRNTEASAASEAVRKPCQQP